MTLVTFLIFFSARRLVLFYGILFLLHNIYLFLLLLHSLRLPIYSCEDLQVQYLLPIKLNTFNDISEAIGARSLSI